MSTKIFNGYRIRSRDFGEVHKIVSAFKEVARPLLLNRYYQVMADQCARVCDALALGKFSPNEDTRGQSVISFCSSLVTKAYFDIYRSDRRNPLFDFDAQLTLVPSGDSTLVLFYCEAFNESVVEAWKATAGVEYFGYWNNTDRDEACSEEEWEARGAAWDEALGRGAPAVVGYTTEILGLYGLPYAGTKEVLSHVQPRHERALVWAVDLLVDEQTSGKILTADDVGKVVQIVNEVRKDTAAMEAKANSVLSVLPEITKENLLENLPKRSQGDDDVQGM